MEGKTVDKVAMEDRARMRRAWTVDSWTEGMREDKSLDCGGLEKTLSDGEKVTAVASLEKESVEIRGSCIIRIALQRGSNRRVTKERQRIGKCLTSVQTGE